MADASLRPAPSHPRIGEHARGSRRGRAAFTLIEILITSILLVTLLAGIWGIYRTFSALYETGYVETEQAQLLRSLMQQLSQDLSSAILPPAGAGRPPAAPPPAAKGEAEEFAAEAAGEPLSPPSADADPAWSERVGLLGTYDSLRIDVLQSAAPNEWALPASDPYGTFPDAAPPRAGEVVTVVYKFRPPPAPEDWLLAEEELGAGLAPNRLPAEMAPEPLAAGAGEGQLPSSTSPAGSAAEAAQGTLLAASGLSRRELRMGRPQAASLGGARELPEFAGLDPSTGGSLLAADTDPSLDPKARAYPFPSALRGQRAEQEAPSLELPEVVSLEFRYFDGQQWTDAWDSRQRRALPVAVEVALQVDFKKDKKRRGTLATSPAPPADASAAYDAAEPVDPVASDLFSELGPPIEGQLPIHRFVIYLPQASRRQDAFRPARRFPGPPAQQPELPGVPDFPVEKLP